MVDGRRRDDVVAAAGMAEIEGHFLLFVEDDDVDEEDEKGRLLLLFLLSPPLVSVFGTRLLMQEGPSRLCDGAAGTGSMVEDEVKAASGLDFNGLSSFLVVEG